MEEDIQLRLKDFKAQAYDALRQREAWNQKLVNLEHIIAQTEQAILAKLKEEPAS
jgi:hypothetical protein